MNQYQAPDANLQSAASTPQPYNPFAVVFKASFMGSTSVAFLGGMVVLFVTYPNYKVEAFAIFLMFYCISFIVAFIVTLTYGKLVEYVLNALGLQSRISLVIGGVLPSILVLVFASEGMKEMSYAYSVIWAVYAMPIALFGYSLRKHAISSIQ